MAFFLELKFQVVQVLFSKQQNKTQLLFSFQQCIDITFFNYTISITYW